MHRALLPLGLAVGFLGGLGLQTQAFADTLALTFTGGADLVAKDVMAGWRFIANDELVVNGLGLWDKRSDGLDQSHEVGIWTDSGNLIASGIVPSGITAPLESHFRMISISPIKLNAGATYRIAAYYNQASLDSIVTDIAVATTIPQISYLGRAFDINAGSFTFPTGFNSTGLDANFGPTFRVASMTAIPEPSSLLLWLAAASSGLGFCRWSLRRQSAGGRDAARGVPAA